MNRFGRFLPYLAIFLFGAVAASSFSPFTGTIQQARISSIDSDARDAAFPLTVGTTWEYEGSSRQQVGQEQDPPEQTYRVRETVIQHDKAHEGNALLISIRREETRDSQLPTTSTIGYLTDGYKYFRIENEEGLDAVRKTLYGDTSDRDIVAEISRTPTYEFSSANSEGCYRIQNKSLSSNYEETFCAGIGPISMHYTHHGTIDEYSLELVGFSH